MHGEYSEVAGVLLLSRIVPLGFDIRASCCSQQFVNTSQEYRVLELYAVEKWQSLVKTQTLFNSTLKPAIEKVIRIQPRG